MPRALSMQRTVVSPEDRERFLARVKAREAQYASAGCRLWLFEADAMPGAFIEFTEARDAASLAAAHASAAEPSPELVRVYTQVELP